MLRRSFSFGLPALVAACTPVRDPSPETTPGAAPTPEAAETIAVVEPPHASLWKWARGSGGWGENRAQQTTIQTSDGPYALELLPGSPTGSESNERFGIIARDLEGRVRWEAELSRPFVPAGALAHADGRLYATDHSAIASGGSVSSVDMATGRILWRRPLHGLGPIGHDKYRNETQIEVDARGVVVYGNEAQGQYTEVLDPETGERRSLSVTDSRFAALSWEGKGADDPFEFPKGPSQLAVDDTHYVLESPDALDEPAILERIDGHETAWSTTLRNEGSCGGASMLIAGDRLWVAYYCAISSGTQLLVVDPASGSIVQELRVHGLGPIGHSEYFCEVQLDTRHGHVVVRGREAAGRYIEVIEPETFATLVSLSFHD